MTPAARAFQQIRAFFRLGRFHFLAGGFVLHGLGVAAALYAGAALNMQALVWGQVAVTATQSMTHYANEYFDLEADRANHNPTRWSGGSRVLPEGKLSPNVAFATALMAALALAWAVRPGLLTLALLLLAIGFPDEADDRAALLAAYALLPVLISVGMPSQVGIAVALGLPFALWQGWRVWRGAWATPARWNSLALWSVVLLVGTTTAELAAFMGLVGRVFE